ARAPRWMRERPAAYLFPGYLPFALALCTIGPGRSEPARPRRPEVFYGLLAVLCFWLMLGPPLGLWQFVYWLPGLNFIRVPSRFSLLGVLCLGVLAGIGFSRRTARLPALRRRALAAGLAVLFLAESAALPLASEPYTIERPGVDRWLATRPRPFAIAEVPL